MFPKAGVTTHSLYIFILISKKYYKASEKLLSWTIMLMIQKKLQIMLLEIGFSSSKPGSHIDDDPADATDRCHSPGIWRLLKSLGQNQKKSRFASF